MPNFRIDGILVAGDGDLGINVKIVIQDATISISHYRSDRKRTIYAQKPAAIAFVDTLAAELLSGATTYEIRKAEQQAHRELKGVFLGYVDGEQWGGKASGNDSSLILAPFD